MPRKKEKFPSWKKLLAGALAVVAVTSATVSQMPYVKGEKVVEVVDGDTFILENRQPIRLYGINAPELGNCMGGDAKSALASLVLNKRVFLREPLSDGRGRVMALVYTDKLLVNEVMVRGGFAQYKRQGASETEKLKTASDYARENKIGIYSERCYQTEPPNLKCAIKGNYDERQGEKIYFLPTCPYYSLVVVEKYQGDDWFCVEEDALKAGFMKSKNCN